MNTFDRLIHIPVTPAHHPAAGGTEITPSRETTAHDIPATRVREWESGLAVGQNVVREHLVFVVRGPTGTPRVRLEYARVVTLG